MRQLTIAKEGFIGDCHIMGDHILPEAGCEPEEVILIGMNNVLPCRELFNILTQGRMLRSYMIGVSTCIPPMSRTMLLYAVPEDL